MSVAVTSPRDWHDLEVEVVPAPPAGTRYRGRYRVLERSDPLGPYVPDPVCMFCYAEAAWTLLFREPDDAAGFGHVPAAGCCERCYLLIRADDWEQLVALNGGGAPTAVARQSVERARSVLVGSKRVT